MANPDLRERRPLSPHLQIYRPRLTMVMSIMHRITGAALYFATLLAIWWLVALASGPAYFSFVDGLLGSWLGLAVLVAALYALFHHMLGGIRHLIWDNAQALSIASANRMNLLSLAVSAALTVLVIIAAIAAN